MKPIDSVIDDMNINAAMKYKHIKRKKKRNDYESLKYESLHFVN